MSYEGVDDFFKAMNTLTGDEYRAALWSYQRQSEIEFDISVLGEDASDPGVYGMLNRGYAFHNALISICCGPFLRAEMDGQSDVAAHALSLWQERGADSPSEWVLEQALNLTVVSAHMSLLERLRKAIDLPRSYSNAPGYEQIMAVIDEPRYGFMAHRFVSVLCGAYESDPDAALDAIGEMDGRQVIAAATWIDAILAAYGDLLSMIQRQQEMAS